MSLFGNAELLSTKCSGIGPHLVASGKAHLFSRVAAGTWLYSRVTTGMPILNGGLFSEVRRPVQV